MVNKWSIFLPLWSKSTPRDKSISLRPPHMERADPVDAKERKLETVAVMTTSDDVDYAFGDFDMHDVFWYLFR